MQQRAPGYIATSVAGTRVLFEGMAAPIVYTSEDQVTAVAPYAMFGRISTSLQVEYLGVLSQKVELRVVDSAPGIFTSDSTGRGQAAILNEDGTPNSVSYPARAGSIVVMFLTGEGQTDPPGCDGKTADGILPVPILPVTVRIAGQDAEVLYAGGAPGTVAGVMQVNVRVPDNTTPNDAAQVMVTVGGGSSQTSATVAIR